MKLIGSYTSPFVRKISVILLEKNLPFEFVNEFPYQDVNGVGKYNPLGKVPVLVTDGGECWYDSPIIAQYLDQLGAAPAMVPADPKAALKMRQLEALADGVMEAAQALVREKSRPAAQQSESELLRQREKVTRGLDARWQSAYRRGQSGHDFSGVRDCLSQLSAGCARLVRDAASAD